ncbi:MAG: hypothetical protein ACM336_14040, partial [Acidobacteriota bacterium]
MKLMRGVLLCCLALVSAAAAQPQASLRGKLVIRDGTPSIETAAGKFVAASGEPETMAVLKDERLAGLD